MSIDLKYRGKAKGSKFRGKVGSGSVAFMPYVSTILLSSLFFSSVALLSLKVFCICLCHIGVGFHLYIF